MAHYFLEKQNVTVSVHLGENCFVISFFTFPQMQQIVAISRVNNVLGLVSSIPNDTREVT